MHLGLVGRHRLVVVGLAGFVATHVVAMATMATLLRGGMDVASFSVAERMAYVAENPWAWRLGWVPWQLSSASDVWLCVALIAWARALPGRRGSGWLIAALLLDLASVIPEQWAEAMLVGPFVADAQARSAGWAEDFARYVQVTGVWAGGGYTLMTAAWMVGIRRATGRGAWPASAEIALLIAFSAGVAFVWMATTSRAPDAWFVAASAVNAVAFPGVTLWALGAATRIGEAQRRAIPDPSDAAFSLRWPEGRALGWLAPLASEGARDVIRLFSRALPYPTLSSDVTDVVYLSWMVPIVRVRALVPDSVELDDFDGRTPLSVLTYRHGGFGPAVLGPLRALLPSPAQSNWRLYVAPREPGAAQDTVFFLKNAVDHPLYAIGSRLLSDGLPGHLPGRLAHTRDGDTLRTSIDPAGGSAPDLEATVRETEDRAVPADFAPLGDRWEDVLGYLVPQRRAVRAHPAVGLRSSSSIVVDVDHARIRPAEVVGSIESAWLAPIVDGCRPFAFVVPALTFRSTGERWSALGPR